MTQHQTAGVPAGGITLVSPPRLPEPGSSTASFGMVLMPLASGSASLVVALANPHRPVVVIAGLLVLAGSIAVGLTLLFSTRGAARRRVRSQRERYLDYLDGVGTRLRALADGQRASSAAVHPSPDRWPGIAHVEGRRWQRRPGDPRFLLVRLGLGTVPSDTPARGPTESDPMADLDPVCVAAARSVIARNARIDAQPICLPLAHTGSIALVGPIARSRALARAMIAAIAATHDPRHVRIAVAHDGHPEWDWVRWLPHCTSALSQELPLSADLAGPDPSSQVNHWTAGVTPPPGTQSAPQPHLVVVIDGAEAVDGRLFGDRRAATPSNVHRLYLLGPAATAASAFAARIQFSGRSALLFGSSAPSPEAPATTSRRPVGRTEADSEGGATPFAPDSLDLWQASMLARTLAPCTPTDPGPTRRALPRADRTQSVANVPTQPWPPLTTAETLRVPIGSDEQGAPVHLDLKESALGGIGPHGLIIGATGSGKSELLRTLCIGLAIRHPPTALAFMLVDFKGGATFSTLADLPHVAGLVTNLADHLALVDRFRAALSGEIARRQAVLASAGGVPDVHAYAELRRRRPVLDPLPHLLVLIDEFCELLAARPELAELFVTVGRIGRSVGVHLLLATQRLEAGRIRGLESHLSYRIGLRTFSATESREAIGTTDAYHLPASPGAAYLTADSTVYRRFQVTSVSRPAAGVHPPAVRGILPFPTMAPLVERVSALRRLSHTPRTPGGATLADADRTDPQVGREAAESLSIMDVAVRRLVRHASTVQNGRRADPIWLPPLPKVLPLTDPASAGSSSRAAPLAPAPVIGLVDDPERQRQDPLICDFAGAAGNLMIVGAGRSGRTTTLRTIVAALALAHAPGDIEVHCLDLAAGALATLAALPQVAAVAARADPDLITRVVARVTRLIDEREALLRDRGWSSPADIRRARRDGMDVAGDIFVIVDGWTVSGHPIPDLDSALTAIAERGPTLGVHTVLTIGAGGQLRPRLAAAFGGRIELRLSDPIESTIDRGLARALPPDVPGRALLTDRRYAQIAVPALPTVPGRGAQPETNDVDAGDLDAALRNVVGQAGLRWGARERVRTLTRLPDRVGLAEICRPRDSAPSRHELVLGVSDGNLRGVTLDLRESGPHLVILGDPGAGKSTLLRGIAAQLLEQTGTRSPAATRTPPAVAAEPEPLVAMVDLRGDLVGDRLAVEPARCASTARDATRLVADLAAELAERPARGGPVRTRDHPPIERPREIYLLVDDAEALDGPAGNPLAQLMPALSRGRDAGLHLVLARRCSGIGRARFTPLLQTLIELGTPLLLFSGDADEGRIGHGLIPRRLPAGRARLAGRDHPEQLLQTICTPGPTDPPQPVTGPSQRISAGPR